MAAPTPPFVRVFWKDAHSDQTQYAEGEIPHSAILIESRGWLLRQDETGVTIFSERLDDAGRITWRGRSFIPAGMIDRIETGQLRWGMPARRGRMSASPLPAQTTVPTSDV